MTSFSSLSTYISSYRFMDLFPDPKIVRDVQKELDSLIEAGIVKLMALLLNSDTGEIIYN